MPAGGPAALREERLVEERNRRLLMVLAVVLVLSAVVAAAVIFATGGAEQAPPERSVPMRAAGPALAMGPDDAKHRVVVFEDFLCPRCRDLELSTRSFLRDYARTGTARVEYRPFQLLPDPYSTRALTAWSAVLQKGTPQQAYRFHNALYDKQPAASDPSKPGVAELQSMAKDAGVHDASVLEAMGRDNQAFVDAADRAAKDAGVATTPTLLLDGKALHAASIPELADKLESALARG